MKIKSVWDEGHTVDLWSLSHLLAGWLIGYVLFYYQTSFWYAFAITTLVLVSWEVFELVVHITKIFYINEITSNRIFDVVIGLVGFFFAFLFISNFGVHDTFFIVTVLIFVLLEIFGYKHALTKQKMRK